MALEYGSQDGLFSLIHNIEQMENKGTIIWFWGGIANFVGTDYLFSSRTGPDYLFSGIPRTEYLFSTTSTTTKI